MVFLFQDINEMNHSSQQYPCISIGKNFNIELEQMEILYSLIFYFFVSEVNKDQRIKHCTRVVE